MRFPVGFFKRWILERFVKSPYPFVIAAFCAVAKSDLARTAMFCFAYFLFLRFVDDWLDSARDRRRHPERVNPADVSLEERSVVASALALLLLLATVAAGFWPNALVRVAVFVAMSVALRRLARNDAVYDLFTLAKYPLLAQVLAYGDALVFLASVALPLAYELKTNENVRKKIRDLFPLVLLSVSPAAYGAEAKLTHDFLLSGAYKSYHLQETAAYDWTAEFFGAYNPELTWFSPRWKLAIQPSLMYLASPGLSISSPLAANQGLRSRRDVNRLRNILVDTDERQMSTDIDVLYVEHTWGRHSQTLGRRPLGLGTVKYFSVWNRFSPNILSDLSGYRTENPDYAELKYSGDAFGVSGSYVFGGTNRTSAALLNPKLSFDTLEIQALGGQWWNYLAGGIALTVDLFGTAFRVETLGLQNSENTGERDFHLAAGIDRALTSWLSITLEGNYFQNGAVRVENYNRHAANPFQSLLADKYGFGFLDFQFGTFWTGGLGALVNAVDGSMLAIFKLRWSATENVDVFAQGFVPSGGSNVEFGVQSDYYDPDFKTGPVQPISLNLKATF